MEKSTPALQNLPCIKMQTPAGPIVCMVRFLPEYQFDEGVLRGKTGDCESLNLSPLTPSDDRDRHTLDYSYKNKRTHPDTELRDRKHVRWEMIAEVPKMPLSSDVTLPLSTNSAKEESLDLSNYLPMPVLVKEESPKLADDNSMDGPPPLLPHGCSPLPPHLALCQGTSPSPSCDRHHQLLPTTPREAGSSAPVDYDDAQEKTLDLRSRTLPVLTKREVPDHHFPATSPRHHPPASSSPLPRHQRRYRHHDYQRQQHHHHQNDHKQENASSASNHYYRRHLLTCGVTSHNGDTWLSHHANDGVLDLRMKRRRQCSPVLANADHAPCTQKTSPSLHNYIPTPLPPPVSPPPHHHHHRHPLPSPGNSSTAGSYHPHLNGTTLRQEHQEGLLDLRTRTRSPSPATASPPPPPPPHHRSTPPPLIPLHPSKPPDPPVTQPNDKNHPHHHIPHPAPTHLPPPPFPSAPLHHQLLQINHALMRQFLESEGRSGDLLRNSRDYLRNSRDLLRNGGDLQNGGDLHNGGGLLRNEAGLLRDGGGGGGLLQDGGRDLLRDGGCGLLRNGGDGLLQDGGGGGFLQGHGRGVLRDGGGFLRDDGRGLLRGDDGLPLGGGCGPDKPEEEDRLSMRTNPPQHLKTLAPAPNYSPISSVSAHSECHQNDDDDEEEEAGEEEKAEDEEDEEMREASVNETSAETDDGKAAVRKRPGRKKGQVSRVLHLWEFILELLRDPHYCPRIIHWENEREGVFRVLQSAEVARLWGEKKRNKKTMTYEKLSRSLRYSRKEGFFDSLPKGHSYPKKLCFKFGPRSHGWRTHNC